MRLPLTIITLIFTMTCFGNNWELFPLNQRSVYQINLTGKEPVFEVFEKDSLYEKNGQLIFSFNSKIHSEVCIEECSDENYPNHYSSSILCLKSGFSISDSTIITFEDKSFLFIPEAKINDTWHIPGTSLSIRCDSACMKTIYNETDSVKYFSILQPQINNPSLDMAKIVLSKRFGLLEFVPFPQLLFEPESEMARATLVGFETNINKGGFTIPEFQDFFHLSAGDVLFWHCRYFHCIICAGGSPEPDPVEYFYKDSITNAIKTVDSVTYTFTRYTLAEEPVEIEVTYRKVEFEPLLKRNTIDWYYSSYNPIEEVTYPDWARYLWVVSGFNFSDSIVNIEFLNPSSVLEIPSCGIMVNEIFHTFSLDTRFGINYKEYSDPEMYRIEKIVGARTGKNIWGKTNLTSSNSAIDVHEIKIHPNPASGNACITGIDDIDELSLFDITGKLIYTGVSRTFDVSIFENGIYLLKISTCDQNIIKKIIIDNTH